VIITTLNQLIFTYH